MKDFDKWFDEWFNRMLVHMVKQYKAGLGKDIAREKVKILEMSRPVLKETWLRCAAVGGPESMFIDSLLVDLMISTRGFCDDVERTLIKGGMGEGTATMIGTILRGSVYGIFMTEVSWLGRNLYKEWSREQHLFGEKEEEE